MPVERSDKAIYKELNSTCCSARWEANVRAIEKPHFPNLSLQNQIVDSIKWELAGKPVRCSDQRNVQLDTYRLYKQLKLEYKVAKTVPLQCTICIDIAVVYFDPL